MNKKAPLVIEQLLAERQWLHALARSLVRDPSAADDLEQETWATSLERPPSSASSTRGWLATVARNRARDTHRRSTRRAKREAGAARPESLRSAADLAEQADTQRRVIAAVLALENPYQGTVLMRYFDDLDVREIAARMETTPSTVRTRLSRALAQLRTSLRREFGDDKTWKRALAPFLIPDASRDHPQTSAYRARIAEPSGTLGLVVLTLLAVGGVLWWAPWQGDSNTISPREESVVVSDDSPVPAGTIVKLEGHSAQSTNRGQAPSAGAGTAQPGDETPNFRAQDPSARVVIRVVVLDQESSIVEGADVLLIDRSDAKHPVRGVLLGRTTSDAEGRARFEGIAPKGDLHVCAAFQNTSAITAEFDGSNPPREPVRVVLGASRTVAGRVVNEEGHAVEGAAVVVHARFDGSMVAIAIQPTDDGGAFRITGLPETLLQIGEEKPASIEVRAKGYGECWHDFADTKEDLERLTLTLATSRTIEGRIVDEQGAPVADVGLEFPDSVGGTSTDREGRFRAGRLPQRTIKLRINSNRYAPRLLDVPFEGQLHRKLDDIVLRPGKPIAGTILDKHGKPVAGALVAISSDHIDRIVRQGETDSQGTFRFEHFGEGAHEIYVFADTGEKATRTGVHAGDEHVQIRLGS